MRKSIALAWRDNQKLRFLVVGGWNTIFGYLMFLLIYAALGDWLHYLLIAVVSHLLAVTQSFLSQRRWVFGASGSRWDQYLRFNISHLANLILGLILLWLLVDVCALSILVSQALGTLVSVCASFLLHKHYSFRER